jgi:hypothetical protein
MRLTGIEKEIFWDVSGVLTVYLLFEGPNTQLTS